MNGCDAGHLCSAVATFHLSFERTTQDTRVGKRGDTQPIVDYHSLRAETTGNGEW